MSSQLYDSRVQLAKDFMAMKELSKIPFYPSIQTWGIWYGGGTTEECLGHPKKELEIYGKMIKEIPIDGIPIFGHNSPGFLAQSMGYCKTRISNDKITVQTDDSNCIYDGELAEYVKDPVNFLMKTSLPRKYPKLQGSESEAVDAVQKAIKSFLGFKIRGIYLQKQLSRSYDTPLLASAPMTMPFDILLPMRGFKGTVIDARRDPQLVAAATETLTDFCMPMGKQVDFPFKICPMIGPTYLSPKAFDIIYMPSCNRIIDEYNRRGAKCLLVPEGKWQTHFEKFIDRASGTIGFMLDDDDPQYVNVLLNHKFAVIYGIKNEVLMNGNTNSAVDAAKELIDSVGNKHMAISFRRALLSPGDAKKENVQAIGEYLDTFKI